jgi:cytoplasmic iron level regulating protein YaaA (DUF328/UPF0246 family)
MVPSHALQEGTAMSFVIIISPAKKMNVVDGALPVRGEPRFLDRTRVLMEAVQALGYDEAKALWKCSDKLAAQNYERFAHMDLAHAVTPAVIAYEGIQYQHLAPRVMDERSLDYLNRHLRVLSGFYGVLRPFDAVLPYRLEMQARLAVNGARDLYEFWGASLAEALAADANAANAAAQDADQIPAQPSAPVLLNLASVEYARAVTPHAAAAGLTPLACLFGQEVDGKFVQRSTEAKAARGTFVRWLAERGVEDLSELTDFAERGYRWDPARSDEHCLAFVR